MINKGGETMKLKIKMNEKDMVAFGGFCVGLFYLCCLIILNFMTLTSEFRFHGLNPFPALLPGTLPAVLLLFFGLLIGAIVSVKESIFKAEKGIGFECGDTSDKRWSKWADIKEVKKELYHVKASDLEYEKGGIPIITDGDDLYLDTGEYHSLVIGTTGSGKTEGFIKPMIKTQLKGGESIVVNDPKGEIFEENSDLLRQLNYKVVVLNFREPQKGNMWNPLDLPYKYYKEGNLDKAIELVSDVAANMIHETKTNEAFWSHTAADYFVGLALALFEDAEPAEVNLNSISLMSILGAERGRGGSVLQEYFKDKDPAGAAYINVTGTMNAPGETQGGILSQFNQKMKKYLNTRALSEMLSRSDFDMADIGREKTAVFMILHDEKDLYHALASTFVQQCYESLIDVAQQNNGPLPVRVNYVLDEFANMPALSSIGTMITAARSRQIRFHLVIQAYSQLNDTYGKEKAEVIKSNCNINIYLLTTELSSLEEVSKLFGEKKAKKDDKEASVPLISINELQRLPMWSALISTIRKDPIKTTWPGNFKYKYGKLKYRKMKRSEIPERKMTEERLFNVKDVVMKKREKAMKDMMAGKGPKPGPGGPGNFNPFGPPPGMGGPPGAGGMPPGMMGPPPPRPNAPAKPPIDVDAFMKKLNSRIAELDAEEEKEKKATSATDAKPTMSQVVAKEEAKIKKDLPEMKTKADLEKKLASLEKKSIEEIPEPKVKKPVKEVEYENFVTDDQFFDDFFAD